MPEKYVFVTLQDRDIYFILFGNLEILKDLYYCDLNILILSYKESNFVISDFRSCTKNNY